ncbi:RimJ/RimL family protein N-acetyltransferase [Catenuloplanes nepalensis]|uniref:RimJ/RimL family protein N-acetyltransferase n=1 Tax=Catenuloplanes nepalensis TaxID=587533 RepID=A0ABT9N772_9ACTN|nr:GNAT family N-acetyltransferase [Catenuloplanes nepalensis]MDP9799547.1 RimJ/RimL family protein N-acetyltransferase [Catenuloplanes nepalensis]
MKPVEIISGGLRLRAWEPADVDALHREASHPEVQRWLALPTDPAVTAEFVLHRAPAQRDASLGLHLGVFGATDGGLLGSVALTKIDQQRGYAELGFWVAAGARGGRIAERAGRALLEWGFAELGLGLVGWRARVGNHASRVTALRLGFTMEGTGRAVRTAPDGTRSDRWTASLLPGDLIESGRPDSPAIALAARRARVFGNPRPVLTGPGGVRLRPAEERDLAAIVETCLDSETLRWTTVPENYTLADAAGFSLGYQPAQWMAGTAAMFVFAGPDDAYAGNMDLRMTTPDDPLFADVGFSAAPGARGRGYTTAALRTVCEWGFETLGLERIEWLAHVGNAASRRVAEKAGFTVEGVRRSALPHRGERRDVWAAGLVPADLDRTAR